VFECIEGWYNPRPGHSTLGYLSPAEYERHHTQLAESRGRAQERLKGGDR
jgi:transposase InsO family protein